MNTAEHGDVLVRIESGSIELPVLPDFAMKILRMTEDPASAGPEVAKLIERDHVLSAQLVRLANSSFYAGRVPVRSVSQAVIRVGVRAVASLVAAAVQRPLYAGRNGPATSYLAGLWRHALGAAILAQDVTRRERGDDSEGAFLAGLLHDLGKTAILAVLPAPVAGEPWPPEEVLQALHCEAARLLLRGWNLPVDIEAAVVHHHDPAAAGPHARLAAIVGVADRICHRVGVAPFAHPVLEETEDPAVRILGLSEIALADLEVELEDRVAELDAVLSG
jgi:HD-like signal output (HDOD) protein